MENYSTPESATPDADWVRGDLPQPEAETAPEETTPDTAAASPDTPPDVPVEANPRAEEASASDATPVADETPTPDTPPPTSESETPSVAVQVPELPPIPIELDIPTLSLEALIEALLFVADGPTPVSRLGEALDVTPREIEVALENLTVAYQQRGMSLQRTKDKVQLTTAPAAADQIQKFLGLSATTPLSKAALETLAIIAYQQPVTRPQIESLRGVNSDGVLKNLLSKGLIEESGRTEGPGRPTLYSTTSDFLQHFGLTTITELPPLNLDELLNASPAEILKG